MSQQEVFAKAYLAQGNGDLVRVTDFSITYINGGKQVHTLREDGAGVTTAPRECTISFNFVMGATYGMERDYVKAIQDGEIKQLRAKTPGAPSRVFAVTGIYTQCTINGPLDSAVNGSCTFIGALDTQRS